MRLVRTVGGLVSAGVVAIGCAHTPSQQVEPKAPAQTAATPAPAAAPAHGSSPDAVAALSAATATAAADFGRDVRPILEQHCRPCHFEGGKMYERLPFDRPETIRTLGTKLFTRIKAEDEQAVIRRFLAGS
jgi:hypothetical protein